MGCVGTDVSPDAGGETPSDVGIVINEVTDEDTITVLEDGPSLKRYARDVGMVYDDDLLLVSYE